MKKRFNESNKRYKKNIFLTIVALIEILAIFVISTSAWVETVSSIKIFTSNNTLDDDGNLISNGTKGIIESALNHQVSVSDSGSAIDLRNYFRPSGGYHLSPCSSADGENFFFPETYTSGSSSSFYRVGTINDKNVNYVSFTVKVTSVNDFAFDQVPTIKVDGTEISDDLVRFSIGYSASSAEASAKDFHIYGITALTESVVNAADGTEGETTVRAFSDYVKGGNKVITTAANSYLTINMWIQDDASFSSQSSYSSKTVEVSNFKLVPVYPFTLKAVTNNVEGGGGGSVACANGSFGETAVGYCAKNQDVTIKATPNISKGFQFLGWTTSPTSTTYDPTAGTPTNSVYSNSYRYTGSVLTLYAKFSDSHDLFFKPQFKHPEIPNNDVTGTYAAYMWQWNPSTGTLDKQWKVMTYVSSGTWEGYYKCSYKGTAENAIFCYMDPNYQYTDGTNTVGQTGKSLINLTTLSETDIFNSYKYLQTYDLVFPPEMGEYGYIATSRYTDADSGTISDFGNSYVMGYWKDNFSCVTATAGTGGSVSTAYLTKSTTSNTSVNRYTTGSHYVYLDGRKYAGNVGGTQVENHYNKNVTLVAAPDSVHNFDGWYLNNELKSTSTTYTVEAPNNPVRGSGTEHSNDTYQARFDFKPDEYFISASFNNWTTSDSSWKMSGPSSNVYTKKTYLDPGDYEFKIYERIHNKNYSKNYTYHEGYLGADGGDTLSDSESNSMKLTVYSRAEYEFHYNSSTKKFWLSVDNRVSSSIKHGPSLEYSVSMSYDAEHHYYYGSIDNVGIGLKFKINYNGAYYGNGYTYHDGYLGADKKHECSTPGTDMRVDGSNKTYYFHFDAKTKEFWLTS